MAKRGKCNQCGGVMTYETSPPDACPYCHVSLRRRAPTAAEGFPVAVAAAPSPAAARFAANSPANASVETPVPDDTSLHFAALAIVFGAAVLATGAVLAWPGRESTQAALSERPEDDATFPELAEAFARHRVAKDEAQRLIAQSAGVASAAPPTAGAAAPKPDLFASADAAALQLLAALRDGKSGLSDDEQAALVIKHLAHSDANLAADAARTIHRLPFDKRREAYLAGLASPQQAVVSSVFAELSKTHTPEMAEILCQVVDDLHAQNSRRTADVAMQLSNFPNQVVSAAVCKHLDNPHTLRAVFHMQNSAVIAELVAMRKRLATQTTPPSGGDAQAPASERSRGLTLQEIDQAVGEMFENAMRTAPVAALKLDGMSLTTGLFERDAALGGSGDARGPGGAPPAPKPYRVPVEALEIAPPCAAHQMRLIDAVLEWPATWESRGVDPYEAIRIYYPTLSRYLAIPVEQLVRADAESDDAAARELAKLHADRQARNLPPPPPSTYVPRVPSSTPVAPVPQAPVGKKQLEAQLKRLAPMMGPAQQSLYGRLIGPGS